MKMLNNDSMFKIMSDKNHSWIYECFSQFMDVEIQYLMNYCLRSFMQNFMYDVQHQCNIVLLQVLRYSCFQQYMDVWKYECLNTCIHVCSIDCMRKFMNTVMYQCMIISMTECINQFISKLIK
jgi:hypothetical protein